jgi:2'-5' RNA ligase
MRLFIALELSDDVKASVSAIAGALRERLGRRVSARWISPENLHITLWFIGEVTAERAATIMQAVNVPFLTPSFELEIRGVGAFPPQGAPRVFWIGVGEGQESTIALYKEITARVRPGLESERRSYSPHLTLARVKASHARDVRNVLRDLAADAGHCRITAVTVFRSRLSSKGAAYEPLVRVPLP